MAPRRPWQPRVATTGATLAGSSTRPVATAAPCIGGSTTHTGGNLCTSEASIQATLARATAHLPPATRIHLPWALDHLTEPEALLHTFLGDRLAAQAALLADRWRQPMPAPVPSQPSHTPPQQADRQTPNATPLSIPTGPQRTMLNPAAETQQQPTPPDHPPVTYFVLRVYTMLSCMLTCTPNSYLSCALRMAQD